MAQTLDLIDIASESSQQSIVSTEKGEIESVRVFSFYEAQAFD